MKKLMIALSAVSLTLPGAMCDKRVNSAGSAVVAVSEIEIDRAYSDFGRLIDRSSTARRDGKLVVGSPVALRIAADIRIARAALAIRDLGTARSAMNRIDTELKAVGA